MTYFLENEYESIECASLAEAEALQAQYPDHQITCDKYPDDRGLADMGHDSAARAGRIY